MAFLGPDDILVLEKDNGTVRRIQNGVLATQPVLDVKVANEKELGMLGIDLIRTFSNSSTDIYQVFLRFIEKGYDKEELLAFAISHVIQAIRQLQIGNQSAVNIELSIAQQQISSISRLEETDRAENESTAENTTNKLYKYMLIDNKVSHQYEMLGPNVILDLPVDKNTARHVGGVVVIDPNNIENVYTTMGDLDIPNRTTVQNFRNGSGADGSAGILRVTSLGETIGGKGLLGPHHPLDKYFAYGIRNSFGLAFDPVTGNLWSTENGPDFNDEINLVRPGFNSGWQRLTGIAHAGSNLEKELTNFEGNGLYSDPEFVWRNVVAPTAILFLANDTLDSDYHNDMLVAGSNNGKIYRFELDHNRTELVLPGKLADKVADNENETEPIVFGDDFYAVTDLKVGPDGNLYVVSFADGKIYRILNKQSISSSNNNIH